MEKLNKQTFLDDICHILLDGKPVLPDVVPLEYRTVGARRAFDALQTGHKIQHVIRIPRVPVEFQDTVVEIRGVVYPILQVQRIDDTVPVCWQLTLEQPDIAWAQGRADNGRCAQ